MDENAKVTLRLVNSLEAARTVMLEPWTGEYTLHPGKTFDIVAEGSLAYPLEVELTKERIIVTCFGSAGAQMSIFADGQEIQRSE